MPIEFRRVLTPGIAQMSYLIGDSGAGVAAVVDPRPDCGIYIELAHELGLAITHVFETHIHADFMSGARELANRVGNARIYLSREGGATYGFDHEPIADGDMFQFGKLRVTVRSTPGHTPEHVSFELARNDAPAAPWGVLTGDSLFVDSVGRPDLLGEDETEDLIKQLFRTMLNYYRPLQDGVVIYPCHGHGSECGPKIADRLDSSVGYEKEHNRYFRLDDFAEFKEQLLADAPPEPTHYRRLKKLNSAGPPILDDGPVIPPLSPIQFRDGADETDTLILDTRHMLAFGGGHIKGAINIGQKPDLSIWAGWMIDQDKRLLLVLDRDADVSKVRDLLVRVGLTQFAGYLVGGMTAWANAGLPLCRLDQISVRELDSLRDDMQVIDVRKDDEWTAGHVPGAIHAFVPELPRRLEELNRKKPLVTYCASGYRANIAASLLQRHGFDNVKSVPGSWSAWQAAGLPIEDGPEG